MDLPSNVSGENQSYSRNHQNPALRTLETKSRTIAWGRTQERPRPKDLYRDAYALRYIPSYYVGIQVVSSIVPINRAES